MKIENNGCPHCGVKAKDISEVFGLGKSMEKMDLLSNGSLIGAIVALAFAFLPYAGPNAPEVNLSRMISLVVVAIAFLVIMTLASNRSRKELDEAMEIKSRSQVKATGSPIDKANAQAGQSLRTLKNARSVLEGMISITHSMWATAESGSDRDLFEHQGDSLYHRIRGATCDETGEPLFRHGKFSVPAKLKIGQGLHEYVYVDISAEVMEIQRLIELLPKYPDKAEKVHGICTEIVGTISDAIRTLEPAIKRLEMTIANLELVRKAMEKSDVPATGNAE